MTIPLNKYFPDVSPIAMGCMGFGGQWDSSPYTKENVSQMSAAFEVCLSEQINLFDHADIYKHGKAESVFGQVLQKNSHMRDKLIIQSKCGIRIPTNNCVQQYDFSKSWIIESVNTTLKRLKTDYLDILLLHRPDPLMEPYEIGLAFEALKASGKVRFFGTSNMHAYQVDFLKQQLGIPLIVNQLEMSLSNCDWLNEGLTSGMNNNEKYHFSPGIMEYTQLNGIQLQAWGCLAKGKFTGGVENKLLPNEVRTAQLVRQLAEEYALPPEAVLLAWLMRHPASIQPVIGTTNINRISACAKAKSVKMSREHWYQLFLTVRGEKLP